MNDDRWVVLGLAHPRAGWFSELARWSTSAAVPLDFVKCVSADEVRARLSGGRPYSALLVGGNVNGLDRDLVDTVRTAGAAVVIIDAMTGRKWTDLGVDSVLPDSFAPAELTTVLAEHAPPIGRVSAVSDEATIETEICWHGHLVAVTGSGGVGTSTVAMGLAQALAGDASNAAMVLLADLARNGELAMLHDAREIIPGLQELTEAHRGGRLTSDDVRSMVFEMVDRGYHLLLGLRRQRDWTAIRPRAFEAGLDGLRRSYRYVIADVDVDVEGETETGSIDVEDRNLVARTTFGQADAVLVVGTASTKGIHALNRDLRQLATFGVPVERLVPVVNRAPRSPRRHREITLALATLVGRTDDLDGLRSPLFVPERRDLDAAIRDGVRLPASIGQAVSQPVTAGLEARSRPVRDPLEPVTIRPGSLGAWTEGNDP